MNKMAALVLYQWLMLTILLGISSEINGMPVTDGAAHDSNSLNLRDAAVGSGSLIQESQSEIEELLETRDKRHIKTSSETPEILVNETHSNETSFEDYEKEYLINLNKELLEQFLHYDKYLKHLKDDNASNMDGSTTSGPTVSPEPPTPLPHSGKQTTPDVRVDNRILQQKLLELRGMNVNQLASVFNGLHRAATDGVEDPGITSLCCNIG